MAELKWIKLNLDMFDNRKIKQIRKLPGGNDMVLFWVMLLTLAGRSNSQGYILFTENIPYTSEMLATECDIELNTVKMALEIFSKFGMITMKEEVITISGWSEHQNIEGMERAKMLTNERVKKHRAKKKELLMAAQEETCSENCNGNVTLHETLSNTELTHLEVEGDIEVDNTTTATTDAINENFTEFFNSNMGHLITPFEFQTLQSYISDGLHPSVITLALQEAVEADKRDMRYIKTILNRWLENKLTTIAAVMADKRDFEGKKKKGVNSHKQSKTGSSSSQHGSKNVSTFNSFKQREYDFDDLKKKLLGWNKEE
jgi:predicted phage replisome organizer